VLQTFNRRCQRRRSNAAHSPRRRAISLVAQRLLNRRSEETTMRRKQGWGSMEGVLLAAMGAAALVAVALGLHGVARLAAVAVVAALIALAQRAQNAARRASLVACQEVVSGNAQRLQDLSSLQSALAHELNNPLATIKGLAGLMSLEPSRAPQRLSTLQSEVVRMQRIIEELLDFSRPMTPLALERLDLRALVRTVAELHEGMASAKNIELVVEPGQPVEVQGDPRKLKQVLMGLLQNAIEASPENQMIALTVAADEERVRVRVIDRGPGIPAGELAHVLRAGVTTKPNAPGLGLTMARALVEQHRGALMLENRQEGGFEARFELPLDCRACDSAPAMRACA
jgi:signal transduction histidine kinase